MYREGGPISNRPNRRTRRKTSLFEDVRRDPFKMGWVLAALDDMGAQVRNKPMVVAIVGPDSVGEADLWAQIGCAVLVGKPLVLACRPGTRLSPKLRAVADEVVDIPDDLERARVEGAAAVAAAMDRIKDSAAREAPEQ